MQEESIRRKHVKENFVNNLSKSMGFEPDGSISEAEFKQKYGTGYEVYGKENIEEYLIKSMSAGTSEEDMMAPIQEMETVIVNLSGGGKKEFHVRKIEEKEESK